MSTGSENQVANATGTLIANTWELMPGNDMKNSRNAPTNGPTNLPTSGSTSNDIRVFIVGRGYEDPSKGKFTLTGLAWTSKRTPPSFECSSRL